MQQHWHAKVLLIVTARTILPSCNAIHNNACGGLHVCAAMILHAVVMGSDSTEGMQQRSVCQRRHMST